MRTHDLRGVNFLGHLVLSGDDPLVITGNFMADAVKGRDLSAHPEGIQRGIRLHRAIDVFTDGHDLTRLGRERLRPHAGRYAGVVLDLFYDHLLASAWPEYRFGVLPAYNRRMYDLLRTNRDHMPVRTRHMLQYMEADDWLTSYASIDGLAVALHGLSRRAREGGAMAGAERVLVDNLEAYRKEFTAFFAEVEAHTRPLPA